MEIRAPLEDVYQTFANIAPPAQFDTSPLRDASDYSDLLRVPLRTLSAEQLGAYGAQAITTVGSAQDYLYFLPRILELATVAPTALGLEPAIIAGKLTTAGWPIWAEARRLPVQEVFSAAARFSMAIHPDKGTSPESWLCGVALLGGSLERHLLYWRETMSQNGAVHLARWVGRASSDFSTYLAEDGFWSGVDIESRETMADWLASEATPLQLASALENSSSDDRWEFEQALRLLDRWKFR
ncbi:MAG: hypothetical protein J0H41_01045 [Rhizobiales bacterium]|nr:hypothetical protein [Hyphomicrobiales bacterium]